MRRALALLTGLLGVLCVPLALSLLTSWIAVGVHFVLGVLVVGLAAGDGLAGRPAAARGWGAFHVAVSLGTVAALQAAAYDPTRGPLARGFLDWDWKLPAAFVLLWGWVPPALAFAAGGVGEHTRWALARRMVRRRHAAAGQPPAASNSEG